LIDELALRISQTGGKVITVISIDTEIKLHKSAVFYSNAANFELVLLA